MLNNAGKKLVLWSQILLIAGIALSVAAGFVMIWRGAQLGPVRVSYYQTSYLYQSGFIGGGRLIISGFLVMILGSLGSWLTALLLRAFADLTVDTKAIRDRLDGTPDIAQAEIPAAAPTVEPVAETTEPPAGE